MPSEIRLQKIIAASGISSRREAEGWIKKGLVTVNGEVVKTQGVKVDPEKDRILVDGKPLPKNSGKVYLLFNKPRNVMVTWHDPEGRPTIYDCLRDLVPGTRCQAPNLASLKPAGRLDFDSEGLLILTNDGEFINMITHPRHRIPKTYEVKVAGIPDADLIKKLRDGVELSDGITHPAKARVLKKNPHNCWLEIVITEGRNRQVRRMCEAVGYPALKLKRVKIGSLSIENLPKGEYRMLTEEEVRKCLSA